MKNTELNFLIESVASMMGLSGIEYANDENRCYTFDDPQQDCLFVIGDNFQVLSRLVVDRFETIDFCYIDPPYNTGQQFIYSDNRTRRSNGMWGNHHDWLSFMLPRLAGAQLLLKPTGVIAISIDDYEYAHLKMLMDNVFGSENYIATIIVCRSKNGKGSKQNIAVSHEYVLLYGKTKNVTINGLPESESRIYDKRDEFGEFKLDGLFRKKGDASLREDRPNMYYPLYYSDDGKVYAEQVHKNLSVSLPHDSKGIPRRWLWGIDKVKQESWKLYASKNGVIYVKNYNTENKKVKIRSVFDSPDYLTDKATNEIKHLYGEKVFETPKPLALIRDLIECCASPDATILDFFAGTGTTAEAAWDINKSDKGRRKVILVEHCQPIEVSHIAAKSGFKYTSDLTQFRLKSIQGRDSEYRFATVSSQ
jgi:adenine-specific DNA-methyltransferase